MASRNEPYPPLFIVAGSKEELDSDDLEEDEDSDDDEEEDEDEEEASGYTEKSSTEALDGLWKYMDQMDEELRGTNIGQSFNVTVSNHHCYTSMPQMYSQNNFLYYIYTFCRTITRQTWATARLSPPP